jgi:hypothetical protein
VQLAPVHLPQTTEAPGNDTFRDVLDVAGVVIPLAIVVLVLVLAVSWPNIRRWLRHRARRRRHRHHHDGHPGTPPLP